MRTSEIFGLKWNYVDLRRGVIEVRERNYRGEQGNPKSRSSRRDLPMGTLIERYRSLKPAEASGDSFVFHGGGQPLDERSATSRARWSSRWACTSRASGWHTFRRTHLSPDLTMTWWWARGDSNARPLPCQGSALTN